MINVWIISIEWSTEDERGRVRHQMLFATELGAQKWVEENLKGNLSVVMNKIKVHGR